MVTIKKLVNNLLDYIWPRFCLSCQREGELLCHSCLDSIPLQTISYQAWPENNFAFQHCYVCLDYSLPIVQSLIKNFKYKYFSQLDIYLVKILADFAQQLKLPADTIVTNPSLHPRRLRTRGFDQTLILATGLSKTLNLTYLELLHRHKATKAQAKLTKNERLQNLNQAFSQNPKLDWSQINKNRPILIIDDVATTGSTLNAASQCLQKAGFSQIICLVLAKN